MTKHRKPPYKAVLALHLPRIRGKCQWCGLPTEEKTHTGLPRFWHKDCEVEFRIIVFPMTARSYVQKRDKEVCADCGDVAHMNAKGESDWQVDHHIPLWKVKEMEPLKRIEYFKLHNLVTRCTNCHVIKSRGEAGERAHGRAVRGERKPKPKKTWPKRAIAGGEKLWPGCWPKRGKS